MARHTLRVVGLASVCALLLGGSLALAQETAPLPANVISIVSNGTAKATPDILKIKLPASTTTPLAADAAAQTMKKVDELLAQLAVANVPKDAIERSGVSIASPSEGYSSEGPAGFSANEVVTITLKGPAMAQPLDRVSAILDAASKTGVLSCRPQRSPDSPYYPWAMGQGLVSFTVSDPEALRVAALQDAVTKAKKVADGVAKALGVKIERVRSVETGSTYENAITSSRDPGWADRSVSSTSPTTVTLSVSATVQFDFSR